MNLRSFWESRSLTTLLALLTSWGMSLARELPEIGRGDTLLFFFVGEGGADDAALVVNDDYSLDIFVGLESVEGFFDL